MANNAPLVANNQPAPLSESSSTPSASQIPGQNPPLSPVQDANKKMQDYEKYVNELHRRHPETFEKLNHFIQRGDCEGPDRGSCPCSDRGLLSACYKPEECQCGKNNSKCHCRQVKHKVRVYDIHPRETKWDQFLKIGPINAERAYYDAADQGDFLKLQEKLGSPIEENKGIKGKEKPEEGKDGSTDFHLSSPSRLITVNHLSPNVAKLLGGLYDIPADFFNRHLPGTEAISGRLISRLPSSVQIDFGELYESKDTFDELWPGRDIVDGHQVIREAIEQEFLFRDVGWDYQPVEKTDWDLSFGNNKLSSGDEVREGDRRKPLKYVFQFNLTHRISVYSKPPGHPEIGQCAHKYFALMLLTTTAIILFYPSLPIYHTTDVDAEGNHMGLHQEEVYFRGIPDTVPKMTEIKYLDGGKKPHRTQGRPSELPIYYTKKDKDGSKWDYAAAYDWEFQIHLEDYFNRINGVNGQSELSGGNGPSKGQKLNDNDADKKKKKERNRATFVYLFGAPLFEIVAANWARLVVRRDFDLDLLEWRPLQGMQEKTVEEIKSRRIAITKHQRDIAASVEVLRSLAQEERYLKLVHKHDNDDQSNPRIHIDTLTLALLETRPEWNRGRSNGLVAEEAEDNTWDRVFYDFFELQASMDALEKRADKIQDGIFALLSVSKQKQHSKLLAAQKLLLASEAESLANQSESLKQQLVSQEQQAVSQQKSDLLNHIISFASLAVVPFTIVGSVFSVEFTSGGPPKNPAHFAIAMAVTFIVLVAGYSFIYYENDVFGRRLGGNHKAAIGNGSTLRNAGEIESSRFGNNLGGLV